MIPLSSCNDPSEVTFCLRSDKPAYSPGETIEISLFLFRKRDRHLLRAKDVSSLKEEIQIELLDQTGFVVRKFNTLKWNQDLAECAVHHTLRKSYKCGKYVVRATYDKSCLNQIDFILFSRRNADLRLCIFGHPKAVSVGQMVSLRLQLQGHKFIYFPECLPCTVQVFNRDKRNLLNVENVEIKKGKGSLDFEVPVSLEYILVLVEVDSSRDKHFFERNPGNLMAFVQIRVVGSSQIGIQCLPSGGRFVPHKTNTVYVRSVVASEPDLLVAMPRFDIFRKRGDQVPELVLGKVKTQFTGMGKFELEIEKGYSYYMEVNYSQSETKSQNDSNSEIKANENQDNGDNKFSGNNFKKNKTFSERKEQQRQIQFDYNHQESKFDSQQSLQNSQTSNISDSKPSYNSLKIVTLLNPENKNQVSNLQMKLSKRVFEFSDNIGIDLTKVKGVVGLSVCLRLCFRNQIIFQKDTRISFYNKNTQIRLGKIRHLHSGVFAVRASLSSKPDVILQESLVFISPKNVFEYGVEFQDQRFSIGENCFIDLIFPNAVKEEKTGGQTFCVFH